jgi:hypothetical protein
MTSSHSKHLVRRTLTMLAVGLALSGAAGATSRTGGAYAGPVPAASVALRAEPLRLVDDGTALNARAQQTALVDSCASRWYWRSLIEEFTCGFSGQGWIN